MAKIKNTGKAAHSMPTGKEQGKLLVDENGEPLPGDDPEITPRLKKSWKQLLHMNLPPRQKDLN